MELSKEPNLDLARRVLPKPLLAAIEHVFRQGISGVALVGGTALAGFYAGHRRSDDMDLFAKSEADFKAAVFAVRHLIKIGAALSNESLSAQYYHANCLLNQHFFTVDIVLNENLFRVGAFHLLANQIQVGSLDTLLKMKAATLVSRAAEKDLYDLQWLLQVFPSVSIEQLLNGGKEIDGGVNAENILAVLTGTKIRKEACGFSMDAQQTPATVAEGLEQFKKQLVRQILVYLKNEPTPPLGELVKSLRFKK